MNPRHPLLLPKYATDFSPPSHSFVARVKWDRLDSLSSTEVWGGESFISRRNGGVVDLKFAGLSKIRVIVNPAEKVSSDIGFASSFHVCKYQALGTFRKQV